MSEQTNEPIEFSTDIISQIADSCCQKWFDDPTKGLVEILIYPVVGVNLEQLQSLIKLYLPSQQGNWKGLLAAADIDSMKLLDITPQVLPPKEGPRISFPAESIRETEFKGPAIIIAIPAEKNDRDPISIVIPLLRLYRGSAIAWGYPIRMRYNGKNRNTWITISPSKPYYQKTDGPFDSLTMTQDASQTISKLFCSSSSNHDRALFALELITDACEAVKDTLRVRIFKYWSAIETLCDSNNETILSGILFKNRLTDTAKSRALFKQARILRHNVTHKGHHPSSCPHTLERYLQVIFLDMLHAVIELPSQRYEEQFVTRHGSDWLHEKYRKI